MKKQTVKDLLVLNGVIKSPGCLAKERKAPECKDRMLVPWRTPPQAQVGAGFQYPRFRSQCLWAGHNWADVELEPDE